MTTTYNKAIRDKIPELIENSGKRGIVKQLSDEEFLPELEKKLNEEVNEYLSSGDIEELVDITEIINRILELRNVSRKDFESILSEKRKNRGAFDSNYFLIEVRKLPDEA
ncbi:MAG: nucleoside triphosphate pyrophosphohydrolase [Candidatus Bathyarchaeota archaeon]|nr:nucleoside triphosphate pyrophosphohydrolase [Candidatus Bathyarchaeota archaeon]